MSTTHHTPSATADHRVHLDAFDGPLDLLLHLIRKAEVEITDIPIAEIAEQYIEHLSHSVSLDIDAAGEFLVMAATLMEIKSRVLTHASAPPKERSEHTDDGETDDPRTELVRQLLAYKRHRDAADALSDRQAIWIHRFPSARAACDKDALLDAVRERTELDIDDLTVGDLAASYAHALMQVDLDKLGDHHVSLEDDDTPIELHQADILDRVAAEAGVTIKQLFAGRRKAEIVGLFIALLELIRQHRLDVALSDNVDDVALSPHVPTDDEETTPGVVVTPGAVENAESVTD